MFHHCVELCWMVDCGGSWWIVVNGELMFNENLFEK